MVDMVYRARKGAQFNDDQATIFGPHLETLAGKKGTILTPKDVVADGEKKSSPAHTFFEWNNEEASKKWRLQQARHLLGNIMVEIRELNNTPVRAFYNVKVEDKGTSRAYVPLGIAMSEADYRKQIIDEAMAEARSWRNRYQIYTELSSIMNEIDAFKK